jgi:hypothetical protein
MDMSYNIFYKSSIWTKIRLHDEVDIEDVKEQLESGIHPDALELNDPDFLSEWEVLYDTESLLTTEDNLGSETIEIQNNDTKETIWNNLA